MQMPHTQTHTHTHTHRHTHTHTLLVSVVTYVAMTPSLQAPLGSFPLALVGLTPKPRFTGSLCIDRQLGATRQST